MGWRTRPSYFCNKSIIALADRPFHSQAVDRTYISNLQPNRPASVTIFNTARTSHSPELTRMGVEAVT
ncbi:hypothetical protein [Microcoleus sp. CAWBG58]|uniref:hypothetical protein n=1 Tax=Microcoleus sp. CAWBG58 TaxID=2841651 RepID=UPI0025F57129|nr:hypothetical protein [Microcoleus sp. CAWBG58]